MSTTNRRSFLAVLLALPFLNVTSAEAKPTLREVYKWDQRWKRVRMYELKAGDTWVFRDDSTQFNVVISDPTFNKGVGQWQVECHAHNDKGQWLF